jgi:thiol:disulfide interchange protein DsbA
MNVEMPHPARRRLALALASVAAGLPVVTAHAQSVPDEGFDYRSLREPVPTSSPGKIEVIEFFWYACPHCYHLEPHLARWVSGLASDVVLRKVHVAFRGDTHQKIHYTLEALGRAESLGPRVFEEIHQRGNAMNTLSDVSEWARRQGLDIAKFESTWNSFGVQTQQKRANALVTAYKVDGVPMFGINGRYVTSPAMVGGSHARALAVVDHLIGLERRPRRA